MKYIKKINNDYIVFTEKDIDTYAPNSFKEAFKMCLYSFLLFLIGCLILLIINKICLLFFP